MDKTPASFRERLALVIHDLGIKDFEFAQRVGLSKQTMSNYILGNTEPSQSKIAEWVKVFRINANWLLIGEGSMFIDESQEKPDALPQEEILDKLTPEQRNMLTYKRLQTELGSSKERIANGIDAIVMGKRDDERNANKDRDVGAAAGFNKINEDELFGA